MQITTPAKKPDVPGEAGAHAETGGGDYDCVLTYRRDSQSRRGVFSQNILREWRAAALGRRIYDGGCCKTELARFATLWQFTGVTNLDHRLGNKRTLGVDKALIGCRYCVAGLLGENRLCDGERSGTPEPSPTGQNATAQAAASSLYYVRMWYLTGLGVTSIVL
ncbi:hypothetical protein EVAR_48556_1 [Eumeta japonica]|uniref:Uncharacterized protein n=1 Tax=Eumeta variegata TaxID=151549 RepID=A0A4C1YAZ6_EUMVA|nr:hypothetical protein EVAR_48556_1 [Eumeta japonica]